MVLAYLHLVTELWKPIWSGYFQISAVGLTTSSTFSLISFGTQLVLSAGAVTMTGRIEDEGTGVGPDHIPVDGVVIDDLDLAPRKGKGLSARHSASWTSLALILCGLQNSFIHVEYLLVSNF